MAVKTIQTQQKAPEKKATRTPIDRQRGKPSVQLRKENKHLRRKYGKTIQDAKLS